MTIHIRKQSQFELFPGAAGSVQDGRQQGLLFKNLTLSLEHTIVLGIFFLISWVFFFSLGVERGKGSVLAVNPASVVNPVSKETQPLVKMQNVNPQPAITVSQHQPMPTAIKTDQRLPPQNAAVPEKPIERPVNPNELLKDDYTIQVASYKTQESAQKEASVLKQKGFEVFVLPKGAHIILCVGKFDEKEAAKKFLNKLKNKYSDCLVRRI